MDGSSRTAIITTKIYWPNGLAVDLHRERLYFADAHLDYIESCDYYGNKRTQIVANNLLIHHPHSLAVFENTIFWVDRGHNQLLKVNRFDPKNKTTITQLSPQALTVKVAHALLQPYEENPCTRANCEHLCLLARNTTSGYTCACQIGYIKDAVNDNRCNLDQSEFLLLMNLNIIGGFVFLEFEMTKNNLKIIKIKKRLKIYPNDTAQFDGTESVTTPTSSLAVASAGDDSSLDVAYSDLEREDGSMLWSRITPINGLRNGYDFTYDFNKQTIYWLEHNLTVSAYDILRIKFDGEDRQRLNSGSAVTSAYCIEFDESSRNLFIGNPIESQIEVLNVDNMQRAVIFSDSSTENGVGRPIEITVNYVDAEVYWLDDGAGVVPKKIGELDFISIHLFK